MSFTYKDLIDIKDYPSFFRKAVSNILRVKDEKMALFFYMNSHENYYADATMHVSSMLNITFMRNEANLYGPRQCILSQLCLEYRLNETRARWLLEGVYVCMKYKQTELLEYCDLIHLDKFDYKPLCDYYEKKKAWCRVLYVLANELQSILSVFDTIEEWLRIYFMLKKSIKHPFIHFLYVLFNTRLIPQSP
jgi:hypothetical protein